MTASPSLGGADISGADSINPAPRQPAARTNAPKTQAPPSQGSKAPAGGRPPADKQPQEGAAPKQQQAQDPWSQIDKDPIANPFLPVPVSALATIAEDPYNSWQVGRNVYDAFFGAFLDQKALSQSVQSVWEQKTAQAAVMRAILAGAPEALNPTAAGQQGATAVLPTALSVGANPENALGGGGALGLGLGVGLPMAANVALGGDNPLQDAAALEHPSATPEYLMRALWGLTTAGLLVGGTRFGLRSQAMRDLMDRFPALNSYAKDLDKRAAAHNRRQSELQKADSPAMGDWLDPVAKEDEDSLRTIAKQAVPKGRILQEETPGAKTLVDVTRKKREEAAKALERHTGAATPVDLEDQVYGGKRLTGAQTKYLIDNWSKHDFGYNLKFDPGSQRPYVNPQSHAGEISADQMPEYAGFLNMARAAIGHAHMDPARGASWASSIRSLLGFNRGSEAASEVMQASAWHLLYDPKTDSVPNEALIRRATEGDPEAYDQLSAAEKGVSDTFRAYIGHLGDRRVSTGYGKAMESGFFFRVPADVKRAPAGIRRGRSPLSHEAQRHRALTIVPSATGELVATPAYRYTEDANQAVSEQRQSLVSTLTDPAKLADILKTKGASLPKEFVGDPAHVVTLLERYAAASGPARSVALKHLTEYVHSELPLFDTGFFKPLQRSLGYQAQSIHSHVAARQMLDTQIVVGSGKDAEIHQAAYDPKAAATQRNAEHLRSLGYRTVSAAGYGDWLWAPQVAKLIEHAAGMGGLGGDSMPANLLRQFLKLNREMISRIMAFPTLHGVNIAGRMGAFGLANYDHPLEVSKAFASKTGAGTVNPALMLPSMVRHGGRWWFNDDLEMWQRRMAAYRDGVAPPSSSYRFGSELAGAMANSLNDTRIFPSFQRLMERAPKPVDKLVKAGKTVGQAHDRWASLFWSQASDTGVMMHEVLKARAMAHGVPEQDAGLWAGTRANDWIGHVMPEDWNPALHELARTLFFAPNWWYTKARLLARTYKDAGFEMSPQMAQVVAGDEIRTVLAQVFWQKVTGEFLNVMGSGHPQEQNQPSARNQVELTLPWTDALPQTWGTPRTDPRTGARRTWENPLARQDRDLEVAAGQDPSKPGLEGPLWFLSNRLSPMIEAMAAAGNVDLRRSIQQGQWTHIDPTTAGFSGEALLAAALFGIPGGSDLLYSYQQEARQPSEVDKPFPVKMTDGVQAALAGLPKALDSTLLAWAAGVNPAFDYAQKSAGQQPSDQQYQQVKEEMDSYEKEMNQQSLQAMTGQITPADWQRWYHDRSLKHQATLQALYRNAPEYTDGTLGLVNAYENLYDQAADPKTGAIDYGKLDSLQAAFRSGHSPSDVAAMDAELSKGETKYPMLKLYHRTIQSYDNWVTTWANRNGYDAGKVKAEQSAYDAILNQNERAHYDASHPELRRFYADRGREFDRSPLGLMYGLFFDSRTALAYLTAHHMTEQQAESAASEQPLEQAG